MTEELKKQIQSLRRHGMSYRQIADYTGVSLETVRYQTRNITPGPSEEKLKDRIDRHEACAYCGNDIQQPHGGRPRRFCCEECRRAYWKAHRDELKQKPEAFYVKVCPYCGKTFEVYGNKRRKYCCHEHYILDYFGPHKYKEGSAESAC